MDPITERLIESVKRARKELDRASNLKETTDVNTVRLLASYRSACENLVFHNFTVFSGETEASLWRAHVEVNQAFREKLTIFKEGEGKTRVVERRKLEKQYTTFIKTSQSFYRGFIQRLASQFGNVAEVLDAARKVKSDTLSVDNVVTIDAAQKQLVLQICHWSLVRLGDLSRYRETQLQSTNRNWGPAKGYYKLAIVVLPTSGAPYHQLGAVAQMDQDTFGTTYYFYRALMQATPHPNARANLELQFRKTCKLWEKPKNHSVKDGCFTSFPSRFVAFHAKCYSEVGFDEHRDLETELIHEITVTLLQRPDTGVLSKICLTNIAAESSALERLKSKCKDCAACLHKPTSLSCAADQGSLRAFHSLQSFNIKLASQLLRVLAVELQRIKKLVESSEMEDNNKLTPIVRCLLPMLRQYSSWLVAEVPFLVMLDAQAKDLEASSFQSRSAAIIQDLWLLYVDALATLSMIYPLKGGKKLKYLLAEDEETIAFQPFANDLVRTRYLDAAGEIKARSTDPGVAKEEPAEEMLHRVRQIVKDGITIAKTMDPKRMVPVRLKEGRFVYTQPESSPRGPKIEGQLVTSSASAGSIKEDQPPSQAQGQAISSFSMDTVMRDMVDDLVEETRPVQIEPENLASQYNRPISVSKETFTAAELVKRIQRSSQNLPSQSQPKPDVVQNFGDSPFPSGLQESETISGSTRASKFFNTPANPPPASSSHSLTNQLIELQQDIQARSSPQQSLPRPSSWSTYETPTGLNSLLNSQPAYQRSPAWSPTASSLETGGEEIIKQLPRKNLFGAIGETPGRTPTSAQPSR